jgi:pilus assembly protein Flp/PilA
MKMFSKFVRDEDGAALAEYGLLLALIAAVCILAITTLGTTIQGIFNDVATALGAV